MKFRIKITPGCVSTLAGFKKKTKIKYMSKKMDPKLVAEDENSFISKHYKIPIKKVREAKAALKKEGKGFRSRAAIYAKLRKMGFTIKTKRFPAVVEQDPGTSREL